MIKIYKKYSLEKDMCNDLIVHAKDGGWTAYPEQGGWDILLVKNKIQVGIQAKLRPNIKLLSQAFPSFERDPGPHYRAVAVGNTNWKERKGFIKLCIALRLIYIDMSIVPENWLIHVFKYGGHKIPIKYYRFFPTELVWTPPFVPELEAGIPSPQTVSLWKILAIKLELIATEKGWVSIEDVRELVQKEAPGQTKSYPRTLLQTYFAKTNERDPRNIRSYKWVLNKKSKPSNKFLNVFEALKGKKNA